MKNKSFGRKREKSQGSQGKNQRDCRALIHLKIQVRVRLSFNSNGLYNFDFEFNMVLVEN